MVIVFLDPNTDNLYICSENEKMKKIDLGNANLLSFIPDDDLLYVQDGVFLTKQQFQGWLEGGAQFSVPAPRQAPAIPALPMSQPVQTRQASQPPQARHYDPNRLYIKPAHNGSVLIPDIHTEKYPDGLKMNGKWDFVPIDDIGGIDVINSNRFIRNQLEKKRIQIVDEAFVRKHQDKAHPYVSPAQRSIDSILIDEPAKKAVKGFFDQEDEETEGDYGPIINVRGD